METATPNDGPAVLLYRALRDRHMVVAEEIFRHNENFFRVHPHWISRAAVLVRNAEAGEPNIFAPIIADPFYSCARYPENDEHWWHKLIEQHVPAVFLAVHANRMDVAKFMVQHGEGDVLNQQSHDSGWTALHWAARLDLPEIVKLLNAEFGTRLKANLKDGSGNTPLHYARGHRVRRELLKRPDIIDMKVEELAELRRLTDSLGSLQTLACTIVQVTSIGVVGGAGSWVLNFMAFVFGMATCLAAVANRLPTPPAEHARVRVLKVTGVLLAVTVACVLFAFGMSQFADMPAYNARTMVPVGIAVAACTAMATVTLSWFLGRLLTSP